ncbi:LysR family transcriptional regulator [Photobacterium rosenbergii]|uniref:LysR family transcriptional regulator n=1 Tax=Photobacterium rosenbergii TaxID=294936 RepID=A0ABU3ZMW4_9GAMM|nr:LysR family transcriptional regulator [Photobacterium rosenbergii]MDV5171381.1 LysR family transcriptional regulator [Photobacterium rosenbergii]
MAKDLSANLDLNLLKTLLVIYQEQNLRKASERLFVTQPAVSHALQKLRLHFDDELFTKTRTGLTPTPYAKQLCEALTPALDVLYLAVNTNQEFDPQQLTGKLRIALAPQFIYALGSKLYLAIQQQAPNCQVEVFTWNEATFTELLNGHTHIALNFDITNTSKELYRKPLPVSKPVIIVRRAHPYTRQEMSITDIDSLKAVWACLIVPERSERLTDVEQYYAQHNLKANIGFRSSSPESVLQVVKQTDHLFPTLNIMVPDNHPDFRKINARIDDSAIDYSTICYYHQSKQNDPKTQWLLELIERLILEATATQK